MTSGYGEYCPIKGEFELRRELLRGECVERSIGLCPDPIEGLCGVSMPWAFTEYICGDALFGCGEPEDEWLCSGWT